MTNTKMTKRDYFNMVIAIASGEEFDENQLFDLQHFAEHEIELLERKRSTGKSKANVEQLELMEQIFEALATETEPVTVSTLLVRHSELEDKKRGGVISNQKASAMLKKLVDNGRVAKTIEKKVSYFQVID